jgi:diadenosine tetraphosphate (Ap4A) HIT family hydrolase
MTFELHSDLQRDGIVLGRFPLCLLLLINDANYPWFVLVPQRPGLRELIDFDAPDYQTFWSESNKLCRALHMIFKPDKMNVAALGNVTPQLHVHHVVRYTDDQAWPAPIWGKAPMKAYESDEVLGIRQRFRAASVPSLELK